MTQISYREVGIDGLDLIQELWKLLRLHVKSSTTDFKDQVDQLTFPERKEFLLKKSKGGSIRVDLAEDPDEVVIAYCVSTLTPEKVGEVDSIYVKEEYRSLGIGKQLMKRSLKWMDEKGAESKKILVTVGNQDVVSFYRLYGFLPRSVVLEQLTEHMDRG
ncbi:MAG: GNAT family N-acetyltransferase [Methanobacteriaceae archaeon]